MADLPSFGSTLTNLNRIPLPMPTIIPCLKMYGDGDCRPGLDRSISQPETGSYPTAVIIVVVASDLSRLPTFRH